MLVICRSILGKYLPDHLRIMGETDDTDFSPMAVGREYKVYGLMFYANRTDVLICPAQNCPMWVPMSLFDIVDDKLSEKWSFIATENTEGYSDLFESFGIHAICGYFDLVQSYDHYIGILEREPEALQQFYYHNQ